MSSLKIIINRKIKYLEYLAEEYIQELDNEEDADKCLYAIEVIKDLKKELGIE